MSARRPMLADVLCECARLRTALELERAARQTADGYVEKRGRAIRQFEEGVSILKVRAGELEQEVQRLRAHPFEVPRRREKLPNDRAWTDAWTLRIGDRGTGTSCTVHIAGFADGRLGEVFLRFDKKERGSHGASMADLACTYLSILLQYLHPMAAADPKRYGEELKSVLTKMIGAVDDSGGWTRQSVVDAAGVENWASDPVAPHCGSLRDYLGKKLAARFCVAADETETTTEQAEGSAA